MCYTKQIKISTAEDMWNFPNRINDKINAIEKDKLNKMDGWIVLVDLLR